MQRENIAFLIACVLCLCALTNAQAVSYWAEAAFFPETSSSAIVGKHFVRIDYCDRFVDPIRYFNSNYYYQVFLCNPSSGLSGYYCKTLDCPGGEPDIEDCVKVPELGSAQYPRPATCYVIPEITGLYEAFFGLIPPYDSNCTLSLITEIKVYGTNENGGEDFELCRTYSESMSCSEGIYKTYDSHNCSMPLSNFSTLTRDYGTPMGSCSGQRVRWGCNGNALNLIASSQPQSHPNTVSAQSRPSFNSAVSFIVIGAIERLSSLYSCS
jgi:hypothetical protein